MAEKRKADLFAGKGSFADKLRQRRIQIESGYDSAEPVKVSKNKKKKKSNY